MKNTSERQNLALVAILEYLELWMNASISEAVKFVQHGWTMYEE